jgi:AcrR family transcriptional regulator
MADKRNRIERRARQRNAARSDILDAARRVASRKRARDLSLRSVAAEAGFTPAALYGYFRSKDELLLALAADDLAEIVHAMRRATASPGANGRLSAVGAAALERLNCAETLAAASGAMASGASNNDVERLFNGRLIAVLTELSAAIGKPARARESQQDVVLIAATLTGLALLMRAGRLQALGFDAKELLMRLEQRFSADAQAP